MIHKIGDPLLFTSEQEWGGKGSNLLELAEVVRVPSGFVLSSEAYHQTVGKLEERIGEILQAGSTPEEAHQQIRTLFCSSDLPPSVQAELKLGVKELKGAVLAVRSSATDEDGSTFSFAGQHDTILGVSCQNDDFSEIELAVKNCYASLFNPMALRYRRQHSLSLPNSIALVVQELIKADVAGVMYSATRADSEAILIEAVHGLGIGAVEGKAVDVYKCRNAKYGNYGATATIQKKISSHKKEKYVYNERQKKVVILPNLHPDKETLTDDQVQELCGLAQRIEQYYCVNPSIRKPVDIEFAYKDGLCYVLQSRPITGLRFNRPDTILPKLNILGQTFNVGNPGIVDGPIVVIEEVDPVGSHFKLKSGADIQKKDAEYPRGYILVTPETNPVLDQFLTNCRGMVITVGGILGHAGATAAERGLPFIGSTESITGGNILAGLTHGGNYCLAANREKGIFGYR